MFKKFLLLILFLCLVGFASCKKKDNPIEPPEPPDLIEQTTPLFDSLKGEWSWFRSYFDGNDRGGGVFGPYDNEFKSIIKILSQNKDSSINYEVFVEDTLFHKGSFQVQIGWWDIKSVNMKLPHGNFPDIYRSWCFQFVNLFGDEPYLVFDNCVVHADYHQYQKVKTEQTIPTPLFEALEGEWNWFGRGGGNHFSENEFKSILKILSQNADFTINYEVFVEDTLFHEGRFSFQFDDIGRRVFDIKLPHRITAGGPAFYDLWYINSFPESSSKDTLIFYDYLAGTQFPYYERKK